VVNNLQFLRLGTMFQALHMTQIYGRSYEFTFPEEAIPLIMHIYTRTHATTRASAIFQLNSIGLLMSPEIMRVVRYQKYCVGVLV